MKNTYSEKYYRDNKIQDIEKALYERFTKSKIRTKSYEFSVTMKTGNVVTIKYCFKHWHRGARWWKVTQTATEEVRTFKDLKGIAKSMAYGYIK